VTDDNDTQKWEGTVLYTRLQCSASEAGCYQLEGDDSNHMYGMPAPFDLEDGAELRVTIEVVKPGRFKLNPWRVKDCEGNPAHYHRKIKSGTHKEGFVRYEIEDGCCSHCGMSEQLIRIREAHHRLTGERATFVNYDPYLEPEAA
jgi:hypothetical protein